MELVQGVYENLISKEIDSAIENLDGFCSKKEPLDKGDLPIILSAYVSNLLRKNLEEKLQGEADKDKIRESIDLANKLILEFSDDSNAVSDYDNFLAEVVSCQKEVVQKASNSDTHRPETGFLHSSLFTGRGAGIPLYSEIKKDIESSDEIFFIVSFLRLSGLNLIYEELKRFCSQSHHRFKIITTTYCGITEFKAVERIAELPNTEIRISYNTQKECLHAKSYIFMRNSGCSTAYIGSSNLSKSAQTDGLEWNVRVTNVENGHIINAAKATFDAYWNSPDFVEYKDGDEDKLLKELGLAKTGKICLDHLQQFAVLPHQKRILDRIQAEREQNANYKNLVVAATGTGKPLFQLLITGVFAIRKNPVSFCL